MTLTVRKIGRVDYTDALALQKTLVIKRREEEINDTLLLLEHPPVITMGRRASKRDLLVSEQYLSDHKIAVQHIERGGEATYHGPGQVVGYIIINLYNHERKLKKFIWNLEEVIIQFLKEKFEIDSDRITGLHGIWVGNEKIAAVGISISEKITMHGFALNVNTDLSHFNWIVPCGIRDKGVTSLQKIKGKTYAMVDIMNDFVPYFSRIFRYDKVEFI
jgi:lipoyl(octanoyl) transferase